MKLILKQLGSYRRDAWLCIGLTAMEVLMEILMPFITAIIIDRLRCPALWSTGSFYFCHSFLLFFTKTCL